jgi:hypothetical protein
MKNLTLTCLGLAMVLGGSSVALAAGPDSDTDMVAKAFQPQPGTPLVSLANSYAPAPAGGGGGGSSSGLPHFGIGVKVSLLLGVGVEAATGVTRKSNVRGGFNFFSYDFDQTQNSGDYSIKMRLRSAQVTYDWFPFGGGFHLSPGALIYNDNHMEGDVTFAGGKTLTLGSQKYTSKAGDPITGSVNLALNNYQVSPMFLLGWGNLLKRGGGHFSFNFEFGTAFTGPPTLKFNLTGSACPGNQQINCVPAGSDPTVQANMRAQEAKNDRDVHFLEWTPIISFGFGYKF